MLDTDHKRTFSKILVNSLITGYRANFNPRKYAYRNLLARVNETTEDSIFCGFLFTRRNFVQHSPAVKQIYTRRRPRIGGAYL